MRRIAIDGLERLKVGLQILIRGDAVTSQAFDDDLSGILRARPELL